MRTLPDTRIATKLEKMWKKKPEEWEREIPDRPERDTLRKFVGELRADGTYPPNPRTRHTDGDCG
jgi:hypothetical protein